MLGKGREKILQILLQEHQIDPETFDAVQQEARTTGMSVERVMVRRGLLTEEDVLGVWVRELNIPFLNLSKVKVDPALKTLISERMARHYQIMPVSCLEDAITIAVSDPYNVMAVDDLKSITRRDIDIVLSSQANILRAIDAYYGSPEKTSVKDLTKNIQVGDFEIVEEKAADENIEEGVEEGESAPIIRMVNLILREALRQRASDIHIEPMADKVRVRYRIDGVLRKILDVPKENQNAMIVRIKIMARLDITSSQVPQDGRFKIRLGGKEVDFRVSLLPTTFGQKVVMRILDKSNLSVGLKGLGLSPKAYEALEAAIHKPFGMVMVTGPTGSGKSTTLYSIINELNTVDKNIITVEDPVEYLIEGLTQIQTQAEIGLTFAEGLRAILRQSPDIVMVGEIRDNETADIAIKASLTGQLVFSTLHTNDAAGALTRLVDMGVEPFLVASSLILVSAQRLCRRICSRCKIEEGVDPKVLDGVPYAFPEDAVFYKGRGCEACRQTGYLGRLSVSEILEIDEEIRHMLLRGKSSDDIKEYARSEKGMATLWDDAMAKCLAGQTTLEEVLRVTTHE